MKKLLRGITASLIIFSTFIATSCISVDGLLPSDSKEAVPAYTNEEAIMALKDALKEGIKSASSNLSQENAYFGNAALKILLPEEARPILNTLEKIPGGQKMVDDVVLRLNRTAEESAKEVIDIFVNAITDMTVEDGIKIVRGSDTAATEYLKEKTYNQLVDLYRPKISSTLNKPLVYNVSANKAWTTLVTAYNKAGAVPNKLARAAGKAEPFPGVEVDLASYATEKALDGLFLKIAEEEKSIRENPMEYASEMINKVFNYVKQGITTIYK